MVSRLFCIPIALSLAFPLPSPPNADFPLLENPKYMFGDIYFGNSTKWTQRNALPRDEFLWPNGEVPVQIHPTLNYRMQNIIDAIDYFHQHTCIRFKPRTTEQDYLHIIRDEGCYSAVGRTSGPQALSLDVGCECKGIILHELLHTLGFYHEQNRSDRDKFIFVVYENIREGAEKEFIQLPYGGDRTFGARYDYGSIMHYGANSFTKNGKATMIPKEDYVVLKNPCEKGGLTEIDFYKLRKLYQCEAASD